MDELAGIDFAVTIHQPWATITVEGPRRYHNVPRRPSSMFLGKRVAIYAHPRPDTQAADQATELLQASGISAAVAKAWRTRTVRGAVIGTALVAGLLLESDDPWFVGPFGLLLSQPEALDHPIEMPGKTGRSFWRLPR